MIKTDERERAITQVASHYKQYHKRWNLKQSERKILIELLGCGYTAEDLCLAIDGLHLDDWHRGKNPDNKKWLAFSYAFREHSIQDYIEEAEKAKAVAESRVQLAKEERKRKQKEREEHLKLREKMNGQAGSYQQLRERIGELSN